MSIVTEVPLPYYSFDIGSVSDRAVAKFADQTISIGGRSGTNGQAGQDGLPGCDGLNDLFGGTGGAGGLGTNGQKGLDGEHGTNSQHACIQLDGTVENFHIHLQTYEHATYTNDTIYRLTSLIRETDHHFQLSDSKGIVLVKASGGHGGRGGKAVLVACLVLLEVMECQVILVIQVVAVWTVVLHSTAQYSTF